MISNVHPPVAGFPIAFFILAFLLEGAAFFGLPDKLKAVLASAALVVVIAAVCAVVVAFVTGYWGADMAAQSFNPPEDVISYHHRLGRLLLFAVVPLAVFAYLREGAEYCRGVFKTLYLITLLVCIGLSIFTSHLGGELVFRHGAGVRIDSNSQGGE